MTMMRSVWIAISTMAVANLLTLAGFAAWLYGSGRLDAGRVERVRAIFEPTLASERAEEERQAAVAQAAADEAQKNAKVGTTPLTAEEKIESATASDEASLQQARRVQRETNDLLNTLVRERQELERQRTEFQARVDAFEEMRRRLAAAEGSEQFQKTVQVYQSVKPSEAKNMMSALLESGEVDQVVAYLNALPPRTSSKIISEFGRDDSTVAADLLERLRTLGTAVATPGASPAPPIAAAPPEGS